MELVVVIVILTLAALLVFPKLSKTGEGELRSSARALAATFRYVEDTAISTKTAYRMRINLDESAVQVTKLLANGEEQASDDVLLSEKLLAEGITISDVITSRLGKITNGEVQFDFGPLGLGEPATVHLRSQDGHFYTVRAYPRGGRVKVFDNYSGAGI
jgi:general secretion pathway protein H